MRLLLGPTLLAKQRSSAHNLFAAVEKVRTLRVIGYIVGTSLFAACLASQNGLGVS
jgi:hypothetical protein